MTAYELRLWRCGMGWTQERAAEELGVSCPTYKRMELKREGRMPAPVPRTVEYATTTLTLKAALPDLHRMSKTQVLLQLQHILDFDGGEHA
ncbi:MAG: helix-turn-helix transcriptional regulator [Pantoea sp.]|uniref:helix-turn-helix transcriptional regulator n=1 Tax=Erwiniaceae TaxID=1903409 RepID=UPI00289914B9|nr:MULTISPECIES: helix-turn-helix transcriptional regulator [Pantoea]MDU5836268.1 helix-turn-helix transcriptional regulator [Pantoea sp.]MDU6438364.1 helix-turn-helix transcriptional regulator [Pantoea sp.]